MIFVYNVIWHMLHLITTPCNSILLQLQKNKQTNTTFYKIVHPIWTYTTYCKLFIGDLLINKAKQQNRNKVK